MYIVGIDLSGPSNTAETAVAAFRETADGRLALCEMLEGASDRDIYDLAVLLLSKGKGVFGLDAPLSYNPGGAFALHGAPVADVRQFKNKAESRGRLLSWLEQQGMHGVAGCNDSSDHLVAACGCALAAWCWHRGQSVWLAPAQPPIHPFDYCC